MTLKNRYKETIRPKLLKDLGLKNIHQVPKVVKVNVNRGLGEAASNSKALEASLNEMATITGQKALVTRAKNPKNDFELKNKNTKMIETIKPRKMAAKENAIHPW